MLGAGLGFVSGLSLTVNKFFVSQSRAVLSKRGRFAFLFFVAFFRVCLPLSRLRYFLHPLNLFHHSFLLSVAFHPPLRRLLPSSLAVGTQKLEEKMTKTLRQKFEEKYCERYYKYKIDSWKRHVREVNPLFHEYIQSENLFEDLPAIMAEMKPNFWREQAVMSRGLRAIPQERIQVHVIPPPLPPFALPRQEVVSFENEDGIVEDISEKEALRRANARLP